MDYKDIIDYLFDKKNEEELLDLDDAELKVLNHTIIKVNDEITKFIDRKVHPKSRKKLKKLIFKYSNSIFSYLHKENELIYKNGVADGVKFIITVLSTK